jgi:hypothetical protein
MPDRSSHARWMYESRFHGAIGELRVFAVPTPVRRARRKAAAGADVAPRDSRCHRRLPREQGWR